MNFQDRLLWLRTRDFLAKYHPFIVGVAGSHGLSTTKEAIGRVLQSNRSVYTPPTPYNSLRGVACGILGIDKDSLHKNWFRLLTGSLVREIGHLEPDMIVLEIGTERPGDVDWLSQKIPLQLVVITNVGSSHLDLFHSRENVAHEMMSLVAALPPQGIAVLNADDPLVAAMAEHTQAEVYFFGADQKADVRAMRFDRLTSGKQNQAGLAGEIDIHGQRYEVHLPHIIGRDQLSSILAAITVGHLLQVDMRQLLHRLQTFQPPSGRMQSLLGLNGSIILDDSYEATPESVMADLGTLGALNARRKIVVIGELLNLAGSSNALHRRIGQMAAGIAEIVIGVGQNMRAANAEAISSKVDTHHFDTVPEVCKWLPDLIKTGDVVLVTGGRELDLSRIVDCLRVPKIQS